MTRSMSLVVVLGAAATGCDLAPAGGSLTEMRMAVDESVATGEAATLEEGVIEITTDFDLGDGLEGAARRIHDLVRSQIPCSTAELTDEQTLVIDFGSLEDECTFRGRTYAGVVRLSYAVPEGGEGLVVTHTYEGITNGRVTLDGEATVTWNAADGGGVSRRIVSSFDRSGPRGEFHVEADRTQTFSDPGSGVFSVEGERSWSGPRGEGDAQWEATVDLDFAVPVDGSAVVHRRDHEFTLSFEQIDDDTVEVRVAGPRRDRVFHVTTSGAVDDEGDA